MRRKIDIGILFSRAGSYRLISEACRKGALAAVAAVNADDRFRFEFVPVGRDPRGNVDLYGPLCGEILRSSGARHLVGCVTSWSRKEVIPTLERLGGSLWYPCPYEGFESADRVVYTHACPNQHLLPLLDWAFPRFGRTGWLTGSNYIWGWEINRVARELIAEAGGRVAGERYLPIGDTGVGRLIDELGRTRPDFVLNSLIGPSSYAFLEAYRALGRTDPHFTPERCPVLSCNLTECELRALGPAAEGVYAAGPYFRAPGAAFGSSFEAAAWSSVYSLALRLEALGADPDATLDDLLAVPAQGGLEIDPDTHHATLPVQIAQVRGGAFEVIERRERVVADPYLSRRSGRAAPAARLRLVQ